VQCIGRICGLAVAHRPSVACRSGCESDLANGTRQARDNAAREPGERGLARGGRTWLDQAHSGITDDTRTELRFYPAGEWRNGRSEPIMVGKYGLTVKRSATPSVVRIHHLPHSAGTAPEQAKHGQGVSPSYAARSGCMRLAVANTRAKRAARYVAVAASRGAKSPYGRGGASFGWVASRIRRFASSCCPAMHLA